MIYLLIYDNGWGYSDNENYTIAVFDNYKGACEFCENKGYSETETLGYYTLENDRRFGCIESISIVESGMNKELSYNGEVI
jgi:hypothetical protein